MDDVRLPESALYQRPAASPLVPVILSGGSGTRLWPVSRESFPKQLWPLVSDRGGGPDRYHRGDHQGRGAGHTPRPRAGRKKIVERLRAAGRHEAAAHNRCYRPWGFYESLINGDRFQVKRIMVKPGEKLSLQKHFHRAEHWVVVAGTALVMRDEDEVMLRENESIYLPLGCVHRLSNPGRIPLTLIEVQSGSYLGEDDIVRFEDTYGRT